MADLTVTYLGMEITITDEYCRMREVRSKFDDLAIDAQEIYLERYYKAYEDFQTFANRGISDGYNFLKSYLKNAVDELIQGGVYHADQKMLINTYGEYIFHEWETIANAVEIKEGQTQAEIEAAKQAREWRKATRGKMVGGGFGVKGAVKGIAMAGTFNAVSGILHSGANAIGNSISRSKGKRELQQLYENELQEAVGEAIKVCVQMMGLCVLDALGTNPGALDEMEERASTLRKNFPKIPKADRPLAAAEIIKLSPGDTRTYKLLLSEYGDSNGALYLIAERMKNLGGFCNVRNTILTETSKDIYPDMKKLISKTPMGKIGSPDYLQASNEIRDRLIERAKWLGCDTDHSVSAIETFDESVEKLLWLKDKNSRTVDTVVYDTLELADQARNNRKRAKAIVNTCTDADYIKIQTALRELRELNAEEPKDSVSDFVDEVSKREVIARTVNGTVYDTYELSQKAESNRKKEKGYYIPAKRQII